MSERLNGLQMDEWANQSAPRAKAREGETPARAGGKGEFPHMSDEKRPNTREATPVAASAPRPGPPPQRPKPPVVGTEQVTVRCGHMVAFELFEPRKDKFRDARRKKLTDRDCTACRMKAQEERQAAEMEAARRQRREKAKPTSQQPAKVKGRLPHGSRYDVSYDAAKGAWSGTLTVPEETPGGQPRTFAGEKSAVFRLLTTLDELFRASLAADDAATPGAGADANRDVGGEG